MGLKRPTVRLMEHAASMIGTCDQSVQTASMIKPMWWANSLLKAFVKMPPRGPITRRIQDGTRVYCIGDIHGRDDLLKEMAERVSGDMDDRSFDHAVTVFLGDYVDRGLGSRQVVEQLARGDWPTAIITLAGNHEDLLTAFLKNAEVLTVWRSLGGLETLHSYGVDVGLAMAGRDYAAVQATFAANLPESHRRFLERLEISTYIGDYFFAMLEYNRACLSIARIAMICSISATPSCPVRRSTENSSCMATRPRLHQKFFPIESVLTQPRLRPAG